MKRSNFKFVPANPGSFLQRSQLCLLAILLLTGLAPTVRAGNIYVPNASFESPVVTTNSPYAAPDMDYWEKSPQPVWYDPSQNQNTPWEDLMGEFYNVNFPGEFIVNCSGNQAGFLFALPEAAIYQDYTTVYGTNATPSHAFNALFNVGHSYTLTVGLIGGGGGMAPGATVELSLYYLDASSNQVTVAATTVTNTTANFPTNTFLMDFSVNVPTVNAGDAWAGQNIGIEIASTVGFTNSGGYWDFDDVRLVENIAVPNFSFESPVVPPVSPYAGPDIDFWEKSPQPVWYDPSQNQNTPWADLMGEFYNINYPGEFIDNCNGTQAAFIFALPEAALYQDYTTIYGTNTAPSHAFDVVYRPGDAYTLTVGLIGGGGGMAPGATFELSLYYLDASTNMVTVASTTVTNTAENFPTNTHLVDFSAQIPQVKATDPWAGQHIGIALASTVGFDLAGGYWDLDNVRLTEQVPTTIVNPGVTNGQFNFTLLSDPGHTFVIQAAPSIDTTGTNWAPIGTITVTTGTNTFTDPATGLAQRFYRALLSDSLGIHIHY